MLDRAKISEAVTECLHRCYDAPNLLEALAEYVQELEQSPRWQGYEVDVVKFRAMRVLNRIATESTELDKSFHPPSY